MSRTQPPHTDVPRPRTPALVTRGKSRSATGALVTIVVVSVGMCAWYLSETRRMIGGFGFPLDDAWIHLTFARNLALHGSFAYYPGDPPVAGSTSPLYTCLLASFYRIWQNEFVISYVLGVAAFAVSVLLFHALLRREFPTEPSFVLVETALLATQPRLVLLAVSGMETTLFIALILGAFLSYRTRRTVPLGLCLGLAVWCRPDAIVLWMAIGTDWVVRTLVRRDPDRWPVRAMGGALAIGLGLSAGYVAFNWALSSSPLPTTFGAKGAYYRATMTREHFLFAEVARLFGGGEFSVLWVFAVIGCGLVLWRTLEHAPPSRLLDVLFTLGLVGAYLVTLPFAHRFARYLLPALPSFMLVALWCVRELSHAMVRQGMRTPGRAVPVVVFVVAAVQWGFAAHHMAKVYAYCCAYHHTHHVAAARWLSANAPPDARIGTHDIGAVAFYSGRRVVDMAGIVSPEVVAHIGKPEFTAYLDDFMGRSGVTHTVTLRDWFVPANSPILFIPSPEPEILEVCAFVPGISHMELPLVARLNARAGELLDQGRPQEALGLLSDVMGIDTRSSRAFLLAGAAHAMLGDDGGALRLLERSLALFPGSALAHLELARLHLRAGNLPDALVHLQASLQIDPSFEPAQRLARDIEESTSRAMRQKT